MNAKLTPIKIIRLSKIEKIKEDKIKENIFKANAHWNYWKLQIHWKNLECLDPINIKNNPFCSLTHKFYIKAVKQACHSVGHSKLKPIDYVAF